MFPYSYYMASSAVDHNSNASAVFKLTFAAGGEGHGATAAFLLSNVTGFPSANNETLAQIMSTNHLQILSVNICADLSTNCFC